MLCLLLICFGFGLTLHQFLPFVKQKIDREIDQYIDLKTEIRGVIDRVKDEKLQLVLRYRYIHFCSWEEIASQMGYGLRWIHTLHGKALAAVEEILRDKY